MPLVGESNALVTDVDTFISTNVREEQPLNAAAHRTHGRVRANRRCATRGAAPALAHGPAVGRATSGRGGGVMR